VSERAPKDYLSMLRDKDISYIVAGASTVDLVKAVNQLGEHFGIRRLLLEGGGHINGAFLETDLVHELSILLAPGIDGRDRIPAIFDRLDVTRKAAAPLKLKSVDRREKGTLWLRYQVVRS
jgi:riboflavin biosynthesis pyrimidine reductase